FAWFREQMCTVACPYARLQAVMLDKRSLIVGYDSGRGEPRGKGKGRKGLGDCVDCGACVVACPTGIDIRDGLQLECIACAQCVDACDSVMHKLSRPLGLVRYASQALLETKGKQRGLLRPRIVVYPLLMVAFISAMIAIGERRTVADVTILRGIGLPYVVVDGGVQNQLRVKIENRKDTDAEYSIDLISDIDAKLIAPENPLRVGAGKREQTSVFVLVPATRFTEKQIEVKIRISDGHQFVREIPYRLLGPQSRSRS
ncbi:MAG TPA: 4Fe-4S dicluster domain-containing protein, partial [Polyangiaceae bacterium]